MQSSKFNKVFSLCFALLLLLTATFTGTLAFSTRSTPADGNTSSEAVRVTLLQQQRDYDEKGNVELEDFENHKLLFPIVGSAQYDGNNFDKYGMPTASNYVDQIIRVKNEDSKSAYVRIIVAIPAALDDKGEAENNALHWNLGNRFMPDGNFGFDNTENLNFQKFSWQYSETTVVDGVECNIYIFTYETPLEAGETTAAAAFVGFYLDSDVDIVNGYITIDGLSTGYNKAEVEIPVVAQGVQSAGFDYASEAFENVPDNPWKTGDDQ